MLRKNWSATGSFLSPRIGRSALDLIGVRSQLVFNTFMNGLLTRLEHEPDLDYACGVALAHNRAMLEFCSVDARLLPTGYVPLADFERAREIAAWNIEHGCQARCWCRRSVRATTHPATRGSSRSGRWRRRPGCPSCSTWAAGASCSRRSYFENGMPAVARLPRRCRELPFDRLHGDPGPAPADAVDADPGRHPRALPAAQVRRDRAGRERGCRAGCACSTPRTTPSARTRSGCRTLSLRPSEYVRRQVRVTPYPAEDVGWIVEQSGDEVCLFSDRLPPRGGRAQSGAPLRGLDVGSCPRTQRQRFYCDNFVDLMGAGLAGAA